MYRKLGKSLKGEIKGKGRALKLVHVLFKKKFRKNDQFLSEEFKKISRKISENLSEEFKKSLGRFQKISRKNFSISSVAFETQAWQQLSTIKE